MINFYDACFMISLTIFPNIIIYFQNFENPQTWNPYLLTSIYGKGLFTRVDFWITNNRSEANPGTS